MTTKDAIAGAKTRMEKAVEDFRKEMASTRTGRASVHMLDGVTVDAYGSQMPLNQLANVSAPEPQLITVQPWDVSMVGAIEKAIRGADLGLNPMNDGKLVRVDPHIILERTVEHARRAVQLVICGRAGKIPRVHWTFSHATSAGSGEKTRLAMSTCSTMAATKSAVRE